MTPICFYIFQDKTQSIMQFLGPLSTFVHQIAYASGQLYDHDAPSIPKLDRVTLAMVVCARPRCLICHRKNIICNQVEKIILRPLSIKATDIIAI